MTINTIRILFHSRRICPIVALYVHNRPHAYRFTARPCYGAVGTHPTGKLSRENNTLHSKISSSCDTTVSLERKW